MCLVPEAPKKVIEEEIAFIPKKKEVPSVEGILVKISFYV